MSNAARTTQVPEHPAKATDAAPSTPPPNAGDVVARPTRQPIRQVKGCAREGCLEIAVHGAAYCPLHD